MCSKTHKKLWCLVCGEKVGVRRGNTKEGMSRGRDQKAGFSISLIMLQIKTPFQDLE